MDEVEQFIEHFKGRSAVQSIYLERSFTNQNCYYFSVILKDRFNGTIMYSEDTQHFVTMIDERLYDITGDVTDEYDSEVLVDINSLGLLNDYNMIKETCIDLI